MSNLLEAVTEILKEERARTDGIIKRLDGRIKELEAAPAPQDGADGQDGQDGTKGLDGDMGVPGKDGDNGKDGSDGAVGQTGQTGEKGADGDDGLQGTAGKDGDNGKDGSDGAVGQTGEKGDDGDDGLQGTAGQDGSDGAIGTDGAAGQAGEKGDPGERGVQGERGEQGLDGLGVDTKAWEDRVYREGEFASFNIGQYFQAKCDTADDPNNLDDWERIGSAGWRHAKASTPLDELLDGDVHMKNFGSFIRHKGEDILLSGRGAKGVRGEKGAAGIDGTDGADGMTDEEISETIVRAIGDLDDG